MILYTVYHAYTGDGEFTGTADECQDYIANYGGGWTALSTRMATAFEKEAYYSTQN